MPVYPFKCEKCGSTIEIIRSIHDNLPRPLCCHSQMEQIICPSGVILGRTPGKTTGFYDLDYGRRATEDLTVPGKMERLKKEGRLKDPFDNVPANSGTNQGDVGGY